MSSDHHEGSSEDVNLGCHDFEFSQITKSRSSPHECLRMVFPGKANLPISPVNMIVARECNYNGRGRFSLSDSSHVLSRYLPFNDPTLIDKMDRPAYTSQFSDDGSLFVAGFQGYCIKIYDVDRGWKVYKNIGVYYLRWTVTDTSLSPDRRFLVYSSNLPTICMCDLRSAGEESDFGSWVQEFYRYKSDSTATDHDVSRGIFSVKFSPDGREIVAASKDKNVYVHNIETRVIIKIPAHQSDVNAVCFADESGHIIYSGSDDQLCKVWDRRCSSVAEGKADVVLMGHLEGVTFIDTRGDGRYFISNGKDQAIKLWDIRKVSTNNDYKPMRRDVEWDYRWMKYPEQAKNSRHPLDLSLATYKGHSVLRTLIRCYFSPAHSTGQKYIYTGSADSSVYVYDVLTGSQVAKLNFHKNSVRDCNWHPFYPMLVSSSWDGSLACWEFRGNGEIPVPA